VPSFEILPTNGQKISDNKIRIQYPLFKEIIVPVLADKYKVNSSIHIKWIGQLEQFFYSDRKTSSDFLREIGKDGFFETTHFFEKAFSIDNDQVTLSLLLNRLAQDINYDTHEVPMFVLVDPEVLNEEVLNFKKYWEQSDTKEIWKDILGEWESIAEHWTLYINGKDYMCGFEGYLLNRGIHFD